MADILIVEDDLALQEAYGFILSTKGHVVTSAYNGAEALEQACAGVFDVILLDIHMPVMNGFEFLENYKDKRPSGTKVIVFSNMVEPEVEERAASLGAHSCILKSSMTPAGMLNLIEQAVGTQERTV